MKNERPPGDRESRRFERRLPHPPHKVWRALTDAGELAGWFPEELLTSEREILEQDPPRVLAYTVGDEKLRWELSPIPGGCLLVLTAEVREASPANDQTIASPRGRIQASAVRLAA